MQRLRSVRILIRSHSHIRKEIKVVVSYRYVCCFEIDMQITNITKIYGDKTVALDNISLGLPEEKFIAILGKSGSGKSTLLNLLGLIDKPTSGTIKLFDKDISKLSSKEILDYKREKIGIVFQFFKLIPVLTARDNILLANSNSKKVDKKYFKHIVEALDIEEVLDKYPDQMSGGQKQRVAIARAIINKPKLLLADEPTGNLDSNNSNKVIELLTSISKEYKMTLVVVTHDEDIGNKADYVVRLADGCVLESDYND